MISEDSIKNDLKRIGIEKGDVLFITANIGATGFFYKSRNETISRWIKILTDVVGDEGTIIVAAYTKTFFRFKKDKELVFNRYMKSYVGPLSNALIEDPNSFRSSHPTMSCIGIGKYAETILSNHNSNSLSYDPIGKVIELNGKNLMLGTVDLMNAPMSLHFAQQILGHTKRNMYISMLKQTYFLDNDGNNKIFTVKDSGGCSRGGINLYGRYIEAGIVNFEDIGNARSALIQGKESLELTIKLLKDSPSLISCTHQDCISCRFSYRKSGLGMLRVPLLILRKKFFGN